MSQSELPKFIVLYSIPTAVMADWMKTDPQVRASEEAKMKAQWDAWTRDHASMILLSAACGKTKKITAEGVADAKNDICLYSIIEAESHDVAVKAFENHPHCQIPQAYIEIMPVRRM